MGTPSVVAGCEEEGMRGDRSRPARIALFRRDGVRGLEVGDERLGFERL